MDTAEVGAGLIELVLRSIQGTGDLLFVTDCFTLQGDGDENC